MYVREEMPVEAVLKGSAAKVLFHLLRRNGVPGTNSEMMRGSGVHDRNTYYAARAQLQDLGLWENPYGIIQHLLGKTPQGEGKIPAPGGKIPAPLMENPVTINPELLAKQVVQGMAQAVRTPRVTATLAGEVLPAPEAPAASAATLNVPAGADQEETDYLAACGRVDRMDDSGETFVRNSPRNERTRAQVTVLQAAFESLFGKPLTEGGAKELLGLTGHSAEGVYEVLELAHTQKPNVEHPLGYVKAILRRQQQERPQLVAAAAGDTRPASLDPASEDTYYLKEPTPETKRRQDRLRALGIRFAGDGLGPLPKEDDD